MGANYSVYAFCCFVCNEMLQEYYTHLFTVDLTNDDHFESVGESHEVNCTLYTGQAVNSNDVSINWSGPNGVIANDSSRINVITTTSNGYIHTSTLQFSYISEKDEDISYNCTAVLSRKNESLSYHKSFSMSNLSSKF